jgi:hypothetical protein
VRTRLMQHLGALLGGDGLAAEYLLLHLAATLPSLPGGAVQRAAALARLQETDALDLSLVLGPTAPPALGGRLAGAVRALWPLTHHLPLTVGGLNEVPLAPAFDEATGMLRPGALLLPPGTHVFVDETTLGAGGQLGTRGVGNLGALSALLTTGALPVPMPFREALSVPVAVNILVLSTGRSMLPLEVVVPLQAAAAVDGDGGDGSAAPALADAQLDEARRYLGAVGSLPLHKPYAISDEVRAHILDEYAAARAAVREGGQPPGPLATPEGLAMRLRIARALARSCGAHELSRSLWERAGVLEGARAARLAALPARKGAGAAEAEALLHAHRPGAAAAAAPAAGGSAEAPMR